MNTGHDGSISTCHANGPTDALLRLESLVLQAAPTWPLAAIRHQLARSIDVVVHVERDVDGRRRIAEIAEVAQPSTSADGTTDAPTMHSLGRIGDDGDLVVAQPLERRRR
jgi:pilus assembly protein CpaF